MYARRCGKAFHGPSVLVVASSTCVDLALVAGTKQIPGNARIGSCTDLRHPSGLGLLCGSNPTLRLDGRLSGMSDYRNRSVLIIKTAPPIHRQIPWVSVLKIHSRNEGLPECPPGEF